jgi:GNAT superfamily N-acetyltransferase
VTVTADPATIAEDAQAYLPTRPSTQRLAAEDVVLRHFPHSPFYWYGSATRPRFAEDATDRRLDEIRAWFRDRGRVEYMWMIGPSATPSDLVERLIARGAWREPGDPVSTAMVLRREPPPIPHGIEVRRVASLADHEQAMRIVLGEATQEQWAATRAGLEAAWEEARADDQMYGYLAWRDGEPVAMGQMVWLDTGIAYLGGATTLPAARGRGAFRALVRARWDDAVRRGTSVMVVQAGAMSRPILERLGFRGETRVHTLIDRTD